MLEYLDTPELYKNAKYQSIKNAITTLIQCGTAAGFPGNCISACDILQSVLHRIGIQTRIVECQVNIVIHDEHGRNNFLFVGHDNFQFPGHVDTHTILIVEDENPILIDGSLGHLLPNGKTFVISSLDRKSDKLCEIQFDNVTLTYFEKRNIRLPNIHQKTLLDRIYKEAKSEKALIFIRNMLYISLGLGITNFFLNMMLIILKLTHL